MTSEACGNNSRGGPEACDGTDLAGQTCATRGFSSGMLEMTRQFGHTVAVSLGAVAIGLAGASLQGVSDPNAMLSGFRLAELIMGSIAAVGVGIAFLGRTRRDGSTTIPWLNPRPLVELPL